MKTGKRITRAFDLALEVLCYVAIAALGGLVIVAIFMEG